MYMRLFTESNSKKDSFERLQLVRYKG